MAIVSRSPSAIDITSLSKTYGKQSKKLIHAVHDLNLAVPAGQIFGFLGANGAGKTTTIKMICGLIKPTTGSVCVNGYGVAQERSMAMQQIGVVLEGTRNIYWRLTAWQNVLYFGRLKGLWGKKLHMRAEHLLSELDLWERRNDAIRTFSRGMQQKVAIACALIADPPVILLDEPTLGLDVQSAKTMKEWIIRLTKEQGKTVVLTTHQLDMAQDVCDRVAIMRRGSLLVDQPLNELLHVFSQERYQLRVRGSLDLAQTAYFQDFNIETSDDETVLSASIADQETLNRHLNRAYELGLQLLSVTQVEPDLEEVFVQLLDEGEKGEASENRILSYVQ